MKWAVGLDINESVNNWNPGFICPHPGAIYMYIVIISKFPLKQFGLSKPNSI